jgi:beta-glucosidase/6-phospho-beta-glucosidase/beta-galactosidase
MKYHYIIPLLIILSSCKNNKAAKSDIPSLPAKKTFTTAQQQKVISTINFGITKKQFETLYKNFLKSKKCESGCSIGKFEYSKEYPEFKNDQLYYLELANSGVKYDSYNESIPGLLDDAYQAVKLEYGDADISHPLPNWSSVENFTTYTLKQWNIGEKTIKITLDRINDRYGIELIIYKPAIKEAVDKVEAVKDSLKQDSISKKDKGTL